jgi:hypothetical protein
MADARLHEVMKMCAVLPELLWECRTVCEMVHAVAESGIQHGTGRVAGNLSGRFQMQ